MADFGSPFGASYSVAAAGESQSDAGQLVYRVPNTVSGADLFKGVVLPPALAGREVYVYNEHASNGLKIYPASGDNINGAATDTEIKIEGRSLAYFLAMDDSTWAAQYTDNK